MNRTSRLVLFCLVVAVAAAFLIAQKTKPPTVPKGARAVVAQAASSGKGAVAAFAMQRDQVQSQALAEDRQLAASGSVSTAARARAQADALALSRAIAQEGEVESLLSVKGYPSAAVLITGRGAVVVVGKSGLSSEQAFAIAETVQSVTGMAIQNVSIVPR